MDPKTIFFLIAFCLAVSAYIPYFLGIFKGETKPHAYTWLIWTITTGIGTAGVWYGGGGLPAITFATTTLLTFIIFLLSLKFGTKNITAGDTITLLAALTAVFVWVGLNNPLWSVILGISIDLIGYWPTVRKAFAEPWSESSLAWVLWTLAPLFSLLALDTYSLLTTAYYWPIFVVNALCVVMFSIRRHTLPKPV
ncbi:hypothetical protein K2P56_04300 [Patescibacteria group bacterium]|nr:hypothetical protein [Patescibacteria group bacterium]